MSKLVDQNHCPLITEQPSRSSPRVYFIQKGREGGLAALFPSSQQVRSRKLKMGRRQ
jgi:hypothetical protein